MKFQTPYEYLSLNVQNSQKPSLTQPGQSLTIREMLHRAQRGQPVPINKNLVYGGNQYYPDLDSLDLVDREAYLREAQERIELLKEKMQSEQDAHNLKVQEMELDKYQKMAEKLKPKESTTEAEA